MTMVIDKNSECHEVRTLQKVVVNAWRSRASPLQWSMRMMDIGNTLDGRVTCDVLLRQMFVGLSPSPLLVSYIRYALATQMIERNHFFHAAAEQATPSKPQHFSVVLAVMCDAVKLDHTKAAATKTLLFDLLNGSLISPTTSSSASLAQQIKQTIVVDKEIDTDSMNDETTTMLIDKRKRPADVMIMPDEDHTKKRKNLNDRQIIDLDADDEMLDDHQTIRESKSTRDIYEVDAVAKITLLVLRGIAAVLEDTSPITPEFIAAATSPTVPTTRLIYNNAVACLDILDHILGSQRMMSLLFYALSDAPQTLRELSALLTRVQADASIVSMAGGTLADTLREQIIVQYPNVLSCLYDTLFVPYTPTTEITGLSIQAEMGDPLLSLQLLIEDAISGGTLVDTSHDILYKIAWVRSVRSCAPTLFIFELLRATFVRLAACTPMTNEFLKTKAFILVIIPRFLKAYRDVMPAECVETALQQVSQIPLNEFDDNIVLALLLTLIRHELVGIESMKQKFAMYISDIESLEEDMTPSSSIIEITIDSIESTAAHLHSPGQIEQLKVILLSLNKDTDTSELQSTINVLKSHLSTTFDMQDLLVEAVFEVLDTIDPYNNRKVLVHLLSMLSNASVIECIDIHGYSLRLMVNVIRYCDSLGKTTNDPSIHTYFSIPFNLLTHLVVLYNLKNNQYNLDILDSKLRMTQDTSYDNPFIKWIFDTFKDSEINFGSNYQDGDTSEDYTILRILIEKNVESFNTEILRDYSPWQLVHKLPQLLFLLFNCLEKNLTSLDMVVDIVNLIMHNVPYSSIIIFHYLAKNPTSIPIDQVLSSFFAADGSELDSTRQLTFNSPSLSSSSQESFQLYHYIPETLNLILFPILYKMPFPSPNVFYSSLYNHVVNVYQSTPSPLAQYAPHPMIQQLLQQFLQNKTKLSEIPKDLIQNIIAKTDAFQFVNLLSKEVIDTFSVNQTGVALSNDQIIRTMIINTT
eukprot:gene10246-11948_t